MIPPFCYLIFRLNLQRQIQAVIEQELEGSEYYLVDVVGKENKGKMQFLIDGDQGISIEKCSEISRKVSRYIDEHDLGKEKFIYEISSPGADRPLKLIRQYPKHIGRDLEVKRTNGEITDGELLEVNDDHILLETAGEKKKEKIQVQIMIDEIVESKVRISFKK